MFRNDWILVEFREDKPLLKVVQRRVSSTTDLLNT